MSSSFQLVSSKKFYTILQREKGQQQRQTTTRDENDQKVDQKDIFSDYEMDFDENLWFYKNLCVVFCLALLLLKALRLLHRTCRPFLRLKNYFFEKNRFHDFNFQAIPWLSSSMTHFYKTISLGCLFSLSKTTFYIRFKFILSEKSASFEYHFYENQYFTHRFFSFWQFPESEDALVPKSSLAKLFDLTSIFIFSLFVILSLEFLSLISSK